MSGKTRDQWSTRTRWQAPGIVASTPKSVGKKGVEGCCFSIDQTNYLLVIESDKYE